MNKIIWSYWSGPINSYVEKALESWKKYLPEWDIRFLDDEKLKNYNIKKPHNFNDLVRAKQSDVIRLNLLYNYGGVWMDASIILHENLDWIIKKMGDSPYFTYKIKNKKYVENWLILVKKKKDYSIGKWLDTFIDVLENPDLYKYEKCEKHWSIFGKFSNYFDCFKSYCYLLNTDKKFLEIHNSIPFLIINSPIIPGKEDPFHNFFLPESAQGKIEKFTAIHRKLHPAFKFPLIYLYIFLIILLIVEIVLIANRYRMSKKSYIISSIVLLILLIFSTTFTLKVLMSK